MWYMFAGRLQGYAADEAPDAHSKVDCITFKDGMKALAIVYLLTNLLFFAAHAEMNSHEHMADCASPLLWYKT